MPGRVLRHGTALNARGDRDLRLTHTSTVTTIAPFGDGWRATADYANCINDECETKKEGELEVPVFLRNLWLANVRNERHCALYLSAVRAELSGAGPLESEGSYRPGVIDDMPPAFHARAMAADASEHRTPS